MAHMLARLRGSRIEDIKSVLQADAPKHAEQGLHLEHLWQNVDDLEEVRLYFFFELIIQPSQKNLLQGFVKEALKQDPTVNLPLMTYLEER